MTIYRASDSTDRKVNYLLYDDREDKDKCVQSDVEKVKKDDNHHNFFHDPSFSQEADQYSFMEQESAELIWVKESCNIDIKTTDTQAAVSLQAALQIAIGLIISISILDGEQREKVSQDLFQYSNVNQTNKQKIYIYNTKDAVVRTRDTDIAINIQLLLQVLLTLVVLVDIL